MKKSRRMPNDCDGLTHEEEDHHDGHYTYPVGHHLVAGGDVELVTANNNEKQQDDESQVESFHDDEDDEELENNNKSTNIGSPRTPWYLTAMILLSEVMGTGILSLPYAAKRLGWVSVLLAVPLFAGFAAYSGWLLAQVHHHDTATNLHSFADASTHLLGPTIGRFTQVAMLVNWGANAINYLIAVADGIGDIMETSMQCSYQRALLASLLLVLPCQCRDFHAISKYLSVPSTLAIVIMIFLVLGNLLVLHANKDNAVVPMGNTTAASTGVSASFGGDATLWPPSGTTLLQFLEALGAFVFAYQGHNIFLELMAEMKDPQQFTWSCTVGYGIMCFVYGLTVVVAYGLSGSRTEEFLPDILPPSTLRKTVGVLVCLHITVSYVIACQPLHMWIHSRVFPDTYQMESWRGTIHWFLVTCGYLAFGFLLGNLIPFFADVQALIGSLFGAPTMFGWPAALYLAMAHGQSTTFNGSWLRTFQFVGWSRSVICGVFLLVFTPLFCLLGTSGALVSIVRDAEQAARPFQCDD